MGGPFICRPAQATGQSLGGNRRPWRRLIPLSALAALALLVAPIGGQAAPKSPPEPKPEDLEYRISPGDVLQIFVWKNPELSVETPVRPDGRITTPLVPDLLAQGRRPTDLAAELRRALSEYIQEPVVTVSVKSFATAAENASAIRVVGAVKTPTSVPYRAGLTALDVVIEAGGLTPEANGNGAKLIRTEKDGYKSYPLRLKSLIRGGDARANVRLMPGDIIQIPESLF